MRGPAAALAGPALIVASVLVVLHDFAFGGKATNQHVDLLSYSMPLSCFMGRSLAAGHIPSWNPYALAGFRSAADPQSGWMYLPVMTLFSVLRCGTAIRWDIVLGPIVAGLGTYCFLRSEAISRLSSTFGGLALALAAAGSPFAVWLPFMGIVMWIPLLLAAASRCLQAPTWSRRLVWAAATAVVWGQVVAAFLVSGIVLGTAALAVYGVARTVKEVRAGRLTGSHAARLWGIVLVALVLVNSAYFLPRLVGLPKTSITFGYGQLRGLGSGTRAGGAVGPGHSVYWALKLATSPGTYLGALPLVFCFAGWWSRRHRYLVAALSTMGALSYAISLKAVATGLPSFIRSLPLADQYFHSPLRFGYGLFPAMAALAGVGLETFRQERLPRIKGLMLVPGAVIWGGLLLYVHEPFRPIHLLVVGAAAGAIVLALSLRRPVVLLALPLLLAVEIVWSDLNGLSSGVKPTLTGPLLAPTVSTAAYLRPGPIVQTMREEDSGRYLSLDTDLVTNRGYLLHQKPDDWGLLANQRGMLFELEDVQGYSSVQLRRYWHFVRAVSPFAIEYNSAVFAAPPPVALDLLQIRWVVAPAGNPPFADAPLVARDGRWALYQRGDAPPRASILSSWQVVPNAERALQAVVSPGFNPEGTVILERDPGLRPSPRPAGTGTVAYRGLGPQAAEIVVDAPSPSVVLIRIPYDSGWHATVDGRPAQVLPADYVIQGIPVPAGHHVVRLGYDDPSIGYGLAGSAASLAGLLGVALFLHLRRRDKKEAQGPA